MKINDKVKAKVSVVKGEIGRVIFVGGNRENGGNPALPITAIFNNYVELDFKEDELELV